MVRVDKPLLHRLVYRSRSAIGSDPHRALGEILRPSEKNNARAGITGCLALAEKTFVQVIEGRTEKIAHLMDRIRADDRHHTIEVLADRPIPARLFRGWAMARVTVPPLSRETLNIITDSGGAAHVTGILLDLMSGGPDAVGGQHGFGIYRV